jgi:hypothetical protein
MPTVVNFYKYIWLLFIFIVSFSTLNEYEDKFYPLTYVHIRTNQQNSQQHIALEHTKTLILCEPFLFLPYKNHKYIAFFRKYN